MTTQDLKSMSIFSDFSEEEIADTLSFITTREYQAAGVIYSHGEPSENLFIIEKGIVAITHKLDSDIVTLARLPRGYFFGEGGILKKGTKHNSKAIAEEDGTRVLSLSDNAFFNLKEKNPRAALKILEKISSVMSERLTEDTERIATISAINDLVNNPENIEDIKSMAKEILLITTEVIPSEKAFLGIFKKRDEEEIEIIASTGLTPKHLPKSFPQDSDYYIKKLREKKEIRISNHDYEKSEKNFYASKNIMARSIQTENKIIGIIVLADKKTGDFTDNNSIILSIISSQKSFALEEARIRTEKRAREELKREYISI